MSACQRVTIAACCVLLLSVFVSPYTPSPLPIGNMKIVLVTFAILMLPSAIMLMIADRHLTLGAILNAGIPSIEFTCVRLC